MKGKANAGRAQGTGAVQAKGSYGCRAELLPPVAVVAVVSYKVLCQAELRKKKKKVKC